MEGVGARLGRSSTRFQPAVAFTGPVRKWTKRWVPLPNPSTTTTTNSSSSNPNKISNSEPSNLMLYRWTPISPSKDDGVPATPEEDPPKRKFRYVPVSVTKNQKQDAAEDSGSEGGSSPQPTTEDGSSGKTNMDDVLMEDAQEATEEANETNLDLNLN